MPDPRRILHLLPVRLYLDLVAARSGLRARLRPAPRTVIDNIRSCDVGEDLEPAELERIAGRFVRAHLAGSGAKRLPFVRGFHDPRRWPVRGLEHLDGALRNGRGAVLVVSHFPYTPLIPPILRVHGYDVLHISRAGVDASHSAVPAGLNVRPIFDALSRNRAVVIAGDGIRSSSFTSVQLFGREFPLPSGFMRIAMTADSPVLPVFAVRGTRRNPVQVEIEAPLAVDPAGTLPQNLQRFADSLTRRVREQPHLWLHWRLADLFEHAAAWSRSDLGTRYGEPWGGYFGASRESGSKTG